MTSFSKNAKLPKIKRKPKMLTIGIHKNLTESSLLNDLNGIPFDLISDTSDNASGLWLTWKTFFLNILNKHAPIKTVRVRGNNVPYVTAEVKSLMRQRDYLKGKANKTGSKYLRQAYQQLRNKVDYTLRKLKSDYYTKKIEESKGNLKNTWRVLKNVTNRTPKCTLIDQIRVHECLAIDKQQISEEMNRYFSTIGVKLDNDIFEGTTSPSGMVQKSGTVFNFRKISPVQIHNLIMKSANGKATGLDLVSNRLLKIASPAISSQLAVIFNQCIEQGIFPDDLKIGKVVSIFKSGKKKTLGTIDPYQYCQHFAFYQQLYKHFTDNNLLGDKKWGFQSIHSTIHALQKSINNWLLNIDRGKTNAVIFLDLKKTFDTVDHDILLEKLSCHGLQDNELFLFQSYLSNRSPCYSVNGKISGFRPITVEYLKVLSLDHFYLLST